MKKNLLNVLFGTILVATLIGCGNKNAWVNEATEKVGTEITENNTTEFYLNGEVYSFPCEVSDFLDNGWSFMVSTDASETIALGYYCSNPIKMIDASNNIITVYIHNDTDGEITFKEGSVYQLLLDNKSGNVMVPGGLTFDTKIESESDIDNYVNKDLDYMVDGDDYSYILTADDNVPVSVTYEISDLTSTTAKCYQLTQIRYYYDITGASYDFVEDTIQTMDAVLLNDPSCMNEAWLDGCTPEEYISDYRGAEGYLTWSIVYCMGFDFETITDEQLTMIDDIITLAYENADLSVSPQLDEQNMITGNVCDFDMVVSAAQDALLADYPDLDTSNYETSEECFEKMYEEIVNVYNDPAVRTGTLTVVNYVEDYNNEYVWDDIMFIGLGLVNYI